MTETCPKCNQVVGDIVPEVGRWYSVLSEDGFIIGECIGVGRRTIIVKHHDPRGPGRSVRASAGHNAITSEVEPQELSISRRFGQMFSWLLK